jgi:hypothetical protein
MRAFVDDGLLQTGERRVPHLHAEITARDHDHVGGVDDAGELRDRLVPLDLRHDARVAAARRAQQLARQLDVGGIAHERQREIVEAVCCGKADVLAILVGERRRRDAAALAIDTLAVRQLATGDHLASRCAYPAHREPRARSGRR